MNLLFFILLGVVISMEILIAVAIFLLHRRLKWLERRVGRPERLPLTERIRAIYAAVAERRRPVRGRDYL